MMNFIVEKTDVNYFQDPKAFFKARQGPNYASDKKQ